MAVAALGEPLYDDASSATNLLLEVQTPAPQRITSMITVLFASIDRHVYAFWALLEDRSALPDLRTVLESFLDDYALPVAPILPLDPRPVHPPSQADP